MGVLARLYCSNATRTKVLFMSWRQSIQQSIQRSIQQAIRDTYAMQQGVGYMYLMSEMTCICYAVRGRMPWTCYVRNAECITHIQRKLHSCSWEQTSIYMLALSLWCALSLINLLKPGEAIDVYPSHWRMHRKKISICRCWMHIANIPNVRNSILVDMLCRIPPCMLVEIDAATAGALGE